MPNRPLTVSPESNTSDVTSEKSRGEPGVVKDPSASNASSNDEGLTHILPQNHRPSGQSLAYPTGRATHGQGWRGSSPQGCRRVRFPVETFLTNFHEKPFPQPPTETPRPRQCFTTVPRAVRQLPSWTRVSKHYSTYKARIWCGSSSTWIASVFKLSLPTPSSN